MAVAAEFLEIVALAATKSPGIKMLPWPTQGNPGGFMSFQNYNEWQSFILNLNLRSGLPDIVVHKFERAIKLHLLAWADMDLLKAGELVAMTTLELVVKDRYFQKAIVPRREAANQKANNKGRVPYKYEMERAEQPSFSDLLKFMVTHDDLTDDKLPIYHRAGAGSVIAGLTGDVKPGLSGIRNRMAHGHPFDTMPWAGLLEVVRDLIEYAYRDWPGEVAAPVMSGDVGIDFLDEFQGQYSGPEFGFEIG
jgi:hypothetical protein